MKTTTTRLTDKQFHILHKQKVDTWATDKWIRDQGCTLKDFDTLNRLTMQAQKQAHLILKHHKDLINEGQRLILVRYHRKYFNYKARKKIKESEAKIVLYIARKVNRKIFKLYKQLPKIA